MSQQINLFNPQLLQQKEWLDAARMAWMVAATVLAMLALYGWSNYRLTQLAGQRQAVAAQLATQQARLKQLTQQLALRQPSKELENELSLAETMLKRREQVIAALQGSEGDAAQGYAGYLQAFARQSMSGVWLTGFTINNAAREIRINGRALQPQLVPQYIAALGQEPLLKGREFAALSLERQAPEAVQAVDSAERKPVEPASTIVEFKLQSVEKKPAGDAMTEKKP